MEPVAFHRIFRTAPDWSRHDKWEADPALGDIVLKAASEYDLFKTLFYLYFYCISECVDSYGYPVYRHDFKWIEKNSQGLSFIKVIHELKSEDTFRDTFDSLKDTAVYYYYMAPKEARRRFQYLLKKLGWKFRDVTGGLHNIAVEAIDLYDVQGMQYKFLDMICSREWCDQLKPLGTSIFDMSPYKVVHLAYLYSIASICIRLGHPDDSLLVPKTGPESYDFLSKVWETPDMLDEISRKPVLEAIRIALNVMQAFINRS